MYYRILIIFEIINHFYFFDDSNKEIIKYFIFNIFFRIRMTQKYNV